MDWYQGGNKKRYPGTGMLAVIGSKMGKIRIAGVAIKFGRDKSRWKIPPYVEGDVEELTKEQRDAISALLNHKKNAKRVELTFYYFLAAEQQHTPTKLAEKDEKLAEILPHIREIRKILSDKTLSSHLYIKAQDFLGGKTVKSLPHKCSSRGIDFQILKELMILEHACHPVNDKKQRGRKKGSGNHASDMLLDGLYHICREDTGKPLSISDKGTILHKLIAILLPDRRAGQSKIKELVRNYQKQDNYSSREQVVILAHIWGMASKNTKKKLSKIIYV